MQKVIGFEYLKRGVACACLPLWLDQYLPCPVAQQQFRWPTAIPANSNLSPETSAPFWNLAFDLVSR